MSNSGSRPQYFFGRLLSEDDFRLEQQYNLHFVCGIVRGVVTNNIDPTNASRVQINVPGTSSPPLWAAVVQPIGAAHATPEIGNHVAVAFEEGDLKRPLVLGVVSGT